MKNMGLCLYINVSPGFVASVAELKNISSAECSNAISVYSGFSTKSYMKQGGIWKIHFLIKYPILLKCEWHQVANILVFTPQFIALN